MRHAPTIPMLAALMVATAIVDAAPPATRPAPNPYAATRPSDLAYTDEQPSAWTRQVDRAAVSAHWVGLACTLYEESHGGWLPADLGGALSIWAGPGQPQPTHGVPGQGTAAQFLTPEDQRRTAVPDVPTADWVDRHASFAYLAGSVNVRNLTAEQAGTTAMLHTPLATPYDDPRQGPVLIVTYVDGHCGVVRAADAGRLIADSARALDAARRPPG